MIFCLFKSKKVFCLVFILSIISFLFSFITIVYKKRLRLTIELVPTYFSLVPYWAFLSNWFQLISTQLDFPIFWLDLTLSHEVSWWFYWFKFVYLRHFTYALWFKFLIALFPFIFNKFFLIFFLYSLRTFAIMILTLFTVLKFDC